ncbi:hypothetical protein CONLIGDRAFT_293534 [Coniochaeta ligniaria NRRL 30616]|uniref:AB hydrolase-1 domain-containing protein n=1 Tax=Coniochaeta ligniaria NRRL 30616 TaxID=1408157 RepID=A0A1J7JT07_9PEZI|nr:hypothetical protein CONLIGDRAFT_293534 [Coniochaeta ligniaria NRRL 30616]
MSKDNVEIVIVPGSFALPPPYDIVVEGFKSQGYNARVVALLSANDGTRFPAATMQDDAAEIRAAVESILDDPEKPRNVVLAVHSYAGFPGSEALKGLSKADRSAQGKETAVIGFVGMASFLPQEGECLREVLGNVEGSPASEDKVPGGYLAAIPPEFAPYLFNDMDPAEGVRLHATMSRHSSDSYDGKVSYAAWKDIPTLQIIPAIDLIIPVPLQELMYEKAKGAAPEKVTKVVYEGAGHCYLWAPTGVERTVADVVKLIEANS